MNVIKCNIRKGAFSGEKVYVIDAPGISFGSISHPSHLITKDLSRRLTENDPDGEDEVQGYVECRILHAYRDNKTLSVNVPSGLEGETIRVPSAAVLRGIQIPNRINNDV